MTKVFEILTSSILNLMRVVNSINLSKILSLILSFLMPKTSSQMKITYIYKRKSN